MQSDELSGLGRFDIIGRLVERVPLHLSDSLEFLLRATIEVAGYVLFVIAVVWIARLCYVNWSRSTPPSTPSETHAQIIIQSDSEILLWQRVGIIIGDVVALSFLLILVFWSLSVLRYYRFDFDSLSEKPALPDELMFAWMYSTTFAMLVFLSWGPLRKGQISFDFSQVLKHPFTTPGTLQQVVAPLLLALFAFGATIFPRIPFALGGGAPRQVVLHSKLQPDPFNAETVYLIGESNQFLFIAQNTLHKDRALQVNKDSIFYIEFVRKNEK